MDTARTREATRPEALGQWILDALGAHSGMRGGVTRDVRIKDLDIDSLDLIEIWQMLDEEFGVTIDPFEMREAETVGEVLDIVSRPLR